MKVFRLNYRQYETLSYYTYFVVLHNIKCFITYVILIYTVNIYYLEKNVTESNLKNIIILTKK